MPSNKQPKADPKTTDKGFSVPASRPSSPQSPAEKKMPKLIK